VEWRKTRETPKRKTPHTKPGALLRRIRAQKRRAVQKRWRRRTRVTRMKKKSKNERS